MHTMFYSGSYSFCNFYRNSEVVIYLCLSTPTSVHSSLILTFQSLHSNAQPLFSSHHFKSLLLPFLYIFEISV